jgi:hypothetical protein
LRHVIGGVDWVRFLNPTPLRKGIHMHRIILTILLVSGMCGCGLAGTGAAAAAGGASEVQQAAQARQTEEKVRQQVNAAQQQAAQQRQDAERQNE